MNIATFDRFYVEETDLELYKQIEDDDAFVYKKHPGLFLISACVGFQYDLREPLDKPKELTQKGSVLNLNGANKIFDAFALIAEASNEVNGNGELMVSKLMEEYAKGGFKKLCEIFSSPVEKNQKLINYILLNLDS